MASAKQIDELRAAAEAGDDELFGALLGELMEECDEQLLRQLLFLRPYDEIEDSHHEMWSMIHTVEAFPSPLYEEVLAAVAAELRVFSPTFLEMLVGRLVRTERKNQFDRFAATVADGAESCRTVLVQILEAALIDADPESAYKERYSALLNYWKSDVSLSRVPLTDFTFQGNEDRAPTDLFTPVDIYNRGVYWFQHSRNDDALRNFQKVVQRDPTFAAARNYIGVILARLRRWSEAIEVYEQAINADSSNLQARNNLAWLYATCPDANYRDGAKAVALATAAVELSPDKDNYKSTLAAANAEAGNFAEAGRLQHLLLAGATTPEQKQRNAERLALYESQRPFREEYWQPSVEDK